MAVVEGQLTVGATDFIYLAAVTVILAVYVGFPLALLIAAPRPRPGAPPEDLPRVTVFVAAYNEEAVIGARVRNLLAADYPEDRLQVIVASDASTDGTAAAVREVTDSRVLFREAERRGGKNALINRFLGEATGDILVFTDANTSFEPAALRRLVAPFADPSVGLAVGQLRYVKDVNQVGQGEGLYFRYEALLKELESRIGCVTVATGGIYAVRADLVRPLDLDVANDFQHPVQVAGQRRQLVFVRDAVATEQATAACGEEFARRARIVTRGLTGFFRHGLSPRLLASGWGACFLFHKLLRWFIPHLFLLMLVLGPLARSTPVLALFALQLLLLLLAAPGFLLANVRARVLTVPFYFVLINAAAFWGSVRYFTGRRRTMWDKARTTRGGT